MAVNRGTRRSRRQGGDTGPQRVFVTSKIELFLDRFFPALVNEAAPGGAVGHDFKLQVQVAQLPIRRHAAVPRWADCGCRAVGRQEFL